MSKKTSTIQTTALALTTATINNRIQPKPSKSEIIEALAQRKLAKIIADNKVIRAKHEAEEKQLETDLLKHLKANPQLLTQVGLGTIANWSGSQQWLHASVSFDTDKLPPEFEKRTKAVQELGSKVIADYHLPRIDQIKKQIREKMAVKSSRVEEMLKNDAVKAALDKMLNQIEAAAA